MFRYAPLALLSLGCAPLDFEPVDDAEDARSRPTAEPYMAIVCEDASCERLRAGIVSRSKRITSVAWSNGDRTHTTSWAALDRVGALDTLEATVVFADRTVEYYSRTAVQFEADSFMLFEETGISIPILPTGDCNSVQVVFVGGCFIEDIRMDVLPMGEEDEPVETFTTLKYLDIGPKLTLNGTGALGGVLFNGPDHIAVGTYETGLPRDETGIQGAQDHAGFRVDPGLGDGQFATLAFSHRPIGDGGDWMPLSQGYKVSCTGGAGGADGQLHVDPVGM